MLNFCLPLLAVSVIAQTLQTPACEAIDTAVVSGAYSDSTAASPIRFGTGVPAREVAMSPDFISLLQTFIVE